MKRDPVPPLVCLVLLLSTLWANLFSGQQVVVLAWGRLQPRDCQAGRDGACGQSPDGRPHVAADDLPLATKAPDFSLMDVDGKKVNLTSLRGRKLLIAFLPRCEGCPLQAVAEWDDLCAQSTDAALVIIARASRRELAGLRGRGLKARLLSSVGTEVEKQYKAAFLPRLYLVDASGRVRYVQPWGAQLPEMEREIHRFLATAEGSS